MPTYEYECKDCGHVFEIFQSMKDDPLRVCPECGREIRRRINGGTGVIFKGNGFYITDKPYGGQAASIWEKREKDKERERTKEETKDDAAPSSASGSPAPAANSGADTAAVPAPPAAAQAAT